MHETLLEGHCFEGGTLRTEKNALLEEMCHGKGRYVTVQNVPRVGFFLSTSYYYFHFLHNHNVLYFTISTIWHNKNFLF